MAPAQYIPERRDVVWLDFEPAKGTEIGKYRPALVLSSREYNHKTGLLICCPISSSIRGGATEVPISNSDLAYEHKKKTARKELPGKLLRSYDMVD